MRGVALRPTCEVDRRMGSGQPAKCASKRVESGLHPTACGEARLRCLADLSTSAIGTASEVRCSVRGSVVVARVIPITRPSMLASGPPENPGFVSADVAISSLISSRPVTVTHRGP
jgi:hypothetical protein